VSGGHQDDESGRLADLDEGGRLEARACAGREHSVVHGGSGLCGVDDEGFTGQCLQGQVWFTGQRVVRGEDGHQRLGAQVGDDHSLGVGAGPEDRQVVGAGEQAVHELRAEEFAAQFQGDVGLFGPYGAGDAREDVVGGGADEAEGDAACLAGGELRHVDAGAFGLGDQGAGVTGEVPARLGEFDAAGGAVEERDAQLVLQLFDLLGQRGLGNVQTGGCAPEVALLRESEEVAGLSELHPTILCVWLINGEGLGLGRDEPPGSTVRK
jgi:hypothetical protein